MTKQQVGISVVPEASVEGLDMRPVVEGQDVTKADMDSFMAFLNERVGGVPVPVFNEDLQQWAVISNCSCSECAAYREAITPMSSSSLLRAGRYYLIGREGYLAERVPAKAGTILH